MAAAAAEAETHSIRLNGIELAFQEKTASDLESLSQKRSHSLLRLKFLDMWFKVTIVALENKTIYSF